MIKWFAVLDDDNALEGSTEDGSWLKLPEDLKGRRIKKLHIFNENGLTDIDQNKDGYFIANKTVAGLGMSQIDLVGIGYYQTHDDTTRIKWCVKDNLELSFTEARPSKDCGFFLIKNPEKSI